MARKCVAKRGYAISCLCTVVMRQGRVSAGFRTPIIGRLALETLVVYYDQITT